MNLLVLVLLLDWSWAGSNAGSGLVLVLVQGWFKVATTLIFHKLQSHYGETTQEHHSLDFYCCYYIVCNYYRLFTLFLLFFGSAVLCV